MQAGRSCLSPLPRQLSRLEVFLTVNIAKDGLITADYNRVSEVSGEIMKSIKAVSLGYGILGCALTLGRLANPDVRLSPITEAEFVGELVEWVDSYFDIPPQSVSH